MSSIYVQKPENPMQPRVSLSIVSHAQTHFVERLLQSLARHRPSMQIEVILTQNIPEDESTEGLTLPFPVRTIHNTKPLGFAANHNQAFEFAEGEYFVLLNPDVVFTSDVITPLISLLESGFADIAAPLVVNSTGEIQDSYRPLPTPISLLQRRIQVTSIKQMDAPEGILHPDWVAAIFILMKRSTYMALGGMDSRYKLYFEDVDFCCRAQLGGYRILVDPSLSIQHDAQRMSHRSFRHFFTHLISATRFFTSSIYTRMRSNRKDIQTASAKKD